MRIVLSGPMTGLPDFNFPAFNRAAASLRAHGHDVWSPAEIPGSIEMTYADCMRICLAEIINPATQAIGKLPGWENSKGGKAEHIVANILGLREIFVNI